MAKILIVEDDPLMQRMYQKAFSFDGYEVVVAGDGVEGIDKARTEKPTAVLLDVMMPKMNGLDALAKIKSDPDLKKLPVIMLTNLAGSADADKALELGAVKYIVKSEQEPKEVVKMVKEIVAGYTRDEIPGK